jgi:hypothetical protein
MALSTRFQTTYLLTIILEAEEYVYPVMFTNNQPFPLRHQPITALKGYTKTDQWSAIMKCESVSLIYQHINVLESEEVGPGHYNQLFPFSTVVNILIIFQKQRT